MAFLSSGVAALGLELIWVRVLGLAFGSESFGMLGVLAAFFAGLALGSAALHRVVIGSRRPVRIYVVAECVIAAYALTGPRLMLHLADAVPHAIGPLVGDNRSLAALSLNLTIAMLVLLPATFCMGATTVAMVEAWRRRRTAAQNANTVAWLYASNTFGGTLGIVLATYWLLPAAGVEAASGALAAFSLAAAALAWRWERAGTFGVEDRIGPRPSAAPVPAPDRSRRERLATTAHSSRLVYLLLFCTGLAGVGLETVGTHVLAQILENTVYTFANILAVYLLGTAIGAWLYTREPMRRFTAQRDRCTSLLLYGLATAGIFAAAILAHAPAMMSALVPAVASFAWRLSAQTAVIALIFFPPTVCMGATFSHLLSHFTDSGVGYAAALNTIGAALAPFVFGLVLIPFLGYGLAFYSAIAIYLVVFIVAELWYRQPTRWAVIGGSIAMAAVALSYSSLVLIQFPSNAQLLAQRIGLYGIVSVVETSGPNATGTFRPRILQVDQNFQMGGSPGGVEKRMGHLSMLVSGAPTKVLYLGIGTGISAGAALNYAVESVTAVELLPEILDLLPWFAEFNKNFQLDSRTILHASDARRFIRATAETYDAIVADLYHPSRDGTASLYTREHFLAIRSRLRDGGVFVQWLPLYQLRPRDLKTIVRTFLEVFPDANSMIGNYSVGATFGLIGSAPGRAGERGGIDVLRTEELFRPSAGPIEVLQGVADLLATYMLDADGLRRYAGPGTLNTDTNQRITFDAAPAARIQGSSEFRQALASLLPYRRPFPDAFIRTTDPNALIALRRRVAPYGEAANHYLAAEILLGGSSGSTLPAEALTEYLKAYEVEVGFISARRRLLTLAVQYPGSAKEIVQRIWLTHSEQQDIDRLYRRLERVDAPERARAMVSQFLETGGQQ